MSTNEKLKVSVVVATYSSGPGLKRLIDSLDAQTLPKDEWEAVFVDDGSPDDTYERLQELASTRPNMRVHRIENSGWPCRPRNIGTDHARGEYVAYMDHDDALYPDALRAGYEFARANGADVLNGKEARTHAMSWGIDQFREDRSDLPIGEAPFALMPTNPHKLYRRAFLQEHDIRFREGRRVLWEDIFFNVLVAQHHPKVVTLASTPYYYWHSTKASGSTTFVRSRAEWWYWLDQVVLAVDDDLADERLSAARTHLRRHQYRSRLLDAFNNLYARRPADHRKLIFDHAFKLQARAFPAEDDTDLNVSLTLRARLLRQGYRHMLERLTVDDPNIPGRTEALGLRWRDGRLEVSLEGQWRDSTDRRHRLRRSGDRLLKDLPDPYRREFDDADLDVTDEIHAATVEVGMRNRRSRVTWMAPTTSEVDVDAGDDHPEFRVRATAIVDPSTAVFGRPLERETWDLNGRCTLAGFVQQPTIRGSVQPAVHLDDVGVAAAYTHSSGHLVLDFDQRTEPLTSLLIPSHGGRLADGTLRIRLRGLESDQERTIPTEVDVSDRGLAHRTARRGRDALLRLLRRPAPGTSWQRVPAEVTVSGDQVTLTVPRADRVRAIRLGTRRVEGATVFEIGSGPGRLRRLPATAGRLAN